MKRRSGLWFLLLAVPLAAQVIFRTETALVRVDAQVVDRNNRVITGLGAKDFVLLESGMPRPITNFASEDMPMDVLLLIDVSGSMQSHVRRLATASRRALAVLGPDDRVAVMVFDRATRLRLPFRNSREDVARDLDSIIEQETFDGGTDITRALMDAARYIGREGRTDARRAIVILTDDQTERDRDENGVLRALGDADAVLSALIAPDAMGSGGMGWPRGGGGGGIPDIIFGRRRRMPGPVILHPRTQSAKTAEIAKRSGGDSMKIDDASSFETTLARLRQRYALHFHLPEGVQPGQERDIEVDLAAAARRLHPDAQVRFRRINQGAGAGEVIARGPRSQTGAEPQAGGWRRVGEPAAEPQPASPPPQQPAPQPEQRGGWRKVGP